MIAGVNANKRAENRPAVVPPIVLTKANMTNVVREPRTAGRTMVKSKSVVPLPKIW
jgi:hypothetical protein